MTCLKAAKNTKWYGYILTNSSLTQKKDTHWPI